MLLRKLIVPVGLLFSVNGFAENAKFQMDQGVFKWTQTSSEKKPDGGTTEKKKTDAFETMPNSLKLKATWNNMAFYLYPTKDSAPFGLGYFVMPELEVIVNLGMDSNKVDKPKSESTDTAYSLGAKYALSLGTCTVEFPVSFGMSSGKNTVTTTDTAGVSTETKVTSAGSSYGIGATYIMSLADNFAWMAGVSYVGNADESKTGTAKTKTTSTALALNLTTFRVKF